MSTRDDDKRLPAVASPTMPSTGKAGASLQRGQLRVELNEKQLGKAIDGGLQIAGDLAEIGKGIVEIVRIRESSKATVQEIEAKTRQLAVVMRERIEAMTVENDGVVARGQIAVDLMAQLSRTIEAIPDQDSAARQQAIAMLPQLIEFATNRDPDRGD